MKDVISYLSDRELEFAHHISVAKMLEKRMASATLSSEGTDSFRIEVRHINTLKSGLIIHLYNIVEATLTRTLKAVGRTAVSVAPKEWTDAMLKEWVRATIHSGEEKLGEGAIERLAKIGSALASGLSPDPFEVKGMSGSWDDDSIQKIAKRLGCDLKFSKEVLRRSSEPKYRNDTRALKYLARRRNEIAHGETTFEDGATELLLSDIEDLGDRVISYVKEVAISYQLYLDSNLYVTSKAPSHAAI